MKDEIKEILEDYKQLAGEITEKLDNTAEYESWLIIQEYFDKLLDYLTNLQKSQETLIKNDNEIITNLQEENERLKEINKINNDEDYIYTYEELQDKVLKLQKKYNDLSKKLWGEVDDRIKYKSRNYKAIEYIKENADYCDSGSFCSDLRYDECLELLNILQGDDKE